MLRSGRKLSKIVICCKGKAELIRDEPGYLADFQAKALPGFFLLLTVTQERRQKLGRVLLNRKESGLDGFENSRLSRWQSMLKLRNDFRARQGNRAQS